MTVAWRPKVDEVKARYHFLGLWTYNLKCSEKALKVDCKVLQRKIPSRAKWLKTPTTNLPPDSVDHYWHNSPKREGQRQTSKSFNKCSFFFSFFLVVNTFTQLLQVLQRGHVVHLSLCSLEGPGARGDLEDRVDQQGQLGLGHPVGNEHSEKETETEEKKKSK